MEQKNIDSFLEDLERNHRSSPAGKWWQELYGLLQRNQKKDSEKIPVPLILAASGESNASKMCRLKEQLIWTQQNGCLEQAIEFLLSLSDDKWNTGSIETWHNSTYL